jgi:flagellar protein FliO/FliZ
MVKNIFTATICCFIALAVSTVAAEELRSVNQPGINSTNAAYLVKVFSGLVLVIALIFALSWLVKRFGQGTFLSNSNMKIINSLSLGAKEKIVVVEIGERQLLLGVTANSIQTLHKLEVPLSSPTKKIIRKEKAEEYDFSSKIQEILSKNCLR